jgi:hypothetical protein
MLTTAPSMPPTVRANYQPASTKRRSPLFITLLLVISALHGVLAAQSPGAEAAPRLPEIRMHRDNGVPACVTPDRLMAFLQTRNTQLAARYRDIAKWYRHHGEAWRVRWDFAFFQMLLETNYLTYRRGNGDPGDVQPVQNNFAGIGATGGGVRGDRFPDVGTGVLAQIQHLVAYSGSHVPQPVAPRTALKQNGIVESMRRLRRTVRFSDLARRWAADPRYAKSIAAIADSYHRIYCNGTAPRQDAEQRSRGGGWTSGQTSAPPLPKSAAKARARLVANTIWRRSEPPRAYAALQARPQRAMPENRMLAGLQSVARSMTAVVNHWPAAATPAIPATIIAPAPRLAQRAPARVIAARE